MEGYSSPAESAITCPYCEQDAFPTRSDSEVLELLNLTGQNRQIITCESCGERFLTKKDQEDDFTVKAV